MGNEFFPLISQIKFNLHNNYDNSFSAEQLALLEFFRFPLGTQKKTMYKNKMWFYN